MNWLFEKIWGFAPEFSARVLPGKFKRKGGVSTPAFPAEPRQALGLLSSIALSSWWVRAEK